MEGPKKLSLVTYVALVSALLTATAVLQRAEVGELAAAFQWPVVLAVAAAGLAGIFLARRIGVPEMWDRSVGSRWRFGAPALAGAGFGLLTALHAWLRPGNGEVIPFPLSLLVFGAGAILLEIMLRLFATSILAAFFGLFSKSNGASWPFWTAALLSSLYEPLPFILEAWSRTAPSWSLVLVAVQLLLFNLAGAWFYRRAGFVAALSLRWSEYLVWHVIAQSFLGLR